MADKGVLSEMADGSEIADLRSVADGGYCACLGKLAVTGVDSDRVGLTDMMALVLSVLCKSSRKSGLVKRMTRSLDLFYCGEVRW